MYRRAKQSLITQVQLWGHWLLSTIRMGLWCGVMIAILSGKYPYMCEPMLSFSIQNILFFGKIRYVWPLCNAWLSIVQICDSFGFDFKASTERGLSNILRFTLTASKKKTKKLFFSCCSIPAHFWNVKRVTELFHYKLNIDIVCPKSNQRTITANIIRFDEVDGG